MEKQAPSRGRKIKLLVEILVLIFAVVYLPMRFRALKFTNQATRLYNEGKWEEAMAGYERALKAYPGFRPARMNLRDVCLEQADKMVLRSEFAEAEGLYQKALGLDADANDVHWKLATVYWHQGKRTLALDEINAHLQRRPDHQQALDLQRTLTEGK